MMVEAMKQDSELMIKPSSLTKEAVVWLNCLILALFFSKLGLGRYSFANDLVERYVDTIWILLLVFVAVVVFKGPKGVVRTISLILTLPVAILAIPACFVAATGYNEHPDQIETVAQVGEVTFKQVATYDLTDEEICRQTITLEVERPIFGGLLKEKDMLITVRPAFAANTELVYGGKQIRFSSPALLGRKPIVRYYSTSWGEAIKHWESISLTQAERAASSKP